MEWKAEEISVDKLVKQMEALTLTLKIVPAQATPSTLSYAPPPAPLPAPTYTVRPNATAPASTASGVGNLRSAATGLGANQCAFCRLEGHRKLWNGEHACPSLIGFLQTGKIHFHDSKRIVLGTSDKPGSEVALDTHNGKCQVEALEEALKSLQETRRPTVGVKSLSVHASSLGTQPPDLSDSEEEADEEVVDVNAARQQPAKVNPKWKATQDSASRIQKERQQKDARLPLMKNALEGIYRVACDLQAPVILQETPLDMDVDEGGSTPETKAAWQQTGWSSACLRRHQSPFLHLCA